MHSRWLHRYSVVLAACSLWLIITGASVSGNAERPLYFLGQGHVISGAIVGVLTIGLVVWLGRVEKRTGLRRLGWVVLGAVIAESLLGLQTAPQPPAVRVAHAFLAQLFFTATVAIAVLTSGGWRRSPESIDRLPLRWLGMIAPAAVLAQVTLGLAFRHGVMEVIPHLLGAFVIVFLVLGLTLPAIYRPEYSSLRPAAQALLIVLSVQVFLGMALFTMAPMDIDPMVTILLTVVHAATGALTLAGTVVMSLLVRTSIIHRAGEHLAAIGQQHGPGRRQV
jgi:heme A synthase